MVAFPARPLPSPAPSSSDVVRSRARSAPHVGLVVVALLASMAFVLVEATTSAEAHTTTAASGGTAEPSSAVVAERATKTWRERQGQRFLNKLKAKKWAWIRAHLGAPKKENLATARKLRKDKPLKLAGKCYKGVPVRTTAACDVANYWIINIEKRKGKEYVFTGFGYND